MEKCNFNRCELDSVENDDKCILHCKKGEYQEDRLKIGFLNSFYTKLVEYIANYIFQHHAKEITVTKEVLRQHLLNPRNIDWISAIDVVKEAFVYFQNISFPERDNRDAYDYQGLLDKFEGIHFDNCEFYTSSLNLKHSELFFQECIFHNRWYLYNHKILENVNNVLYQMCNFKQDVNTIVADYDNPDLENSIFCNCQFSQNISLESVNIKGLIFNDRDSMPLSARSISILNCNFNNKLLLNNYNITEFECANTIFNDKVEFKQNTVTSFRVYNTNFQKLFDCYQTSFQEFLIEKSIFDDFVGFENCVFGNSKYSQNIEYKANFLYATFLNFVNFRNTKFLCGLDLEHINLKEPPNFLGIYISPDNSPRETFRIIKYSFDRIGNYIEANNFFEGEMRKYKEELKITKNPFRKILLYLYQLTSKYGQSYVRPILLTLLTSLFYWILIIGYKNNTLYSLFPPVNPSIKIVSSLFNNIAKNILPFNKVLKEGMEFVSLVFYILFASFIWLTILAIKRTTRR